MQNNVPKFSSFRPAASSQRERAEKDDDDGRRREDGKKHRHSRARSRSPRAHHDSSQHFRQRSRSREHLHKHHSKHRHGEHGRERDRALGSDRRDKEGSRLRERTPRRDMNTVISKPATLPHGHTEDVFQVDTKGDRANLQYGKSNRWEVSSYRSPNNSRTIGLSQRMGKIRSSDKGLLSNMTREDRQQIDAKSRRLRLSQPVSMVELAEDFLPLSVNSHQGQQAQDRAVSRMADVFSAPSPNQDESDASTSATDPETDDVQKLRQQHQTLQQALSASPTDLQALVDFVNLQDEWVAGGLGGQASSTMASVEATSSQLKLNIIDESLKHFQQDLGALERLLLIKVRLVSTVRDTPEVIQTWEQVLRQHPRSFKLHFEHLKFTVESNLVDVGDFKERVSSFFQELPVTNHLLQHENGAENFIAVISFVVRWYHDAGYSENAMAIWQVAIRLSMLSVASASHVDLDAMAVNDTTPTGGPENSELDKIAQWQDAWDDDELRLDSEGGLAYPRVARFASSFADRIEHNWRTWKRNSDRYSLWSDAETRAMGHCWMPVALSQSSYPYEHDLFRVVFAKDIEPYLSSKMWMQPCIDRKTARRWISAFLGFMDMPPLPPTSEMLLDPYAPLDKDFGPDLLTLKPDVRFLNKKMSCDFDLSVQRQLLSSKGYIASVANLFVDPVDDISAFKHAELGLEDPRLPLIVNTLESYIKATEFSDEGAIEYTAALCKHALDLRWPRLSELCGDFTLQTASIRSRLAEALHRPEEDDSEGSLERLLKDNPAETLDAIIHKTSLPSLDTIFTWAKRAWDLSRSSFDIPALENWLVSLIFNSLNGPQRGGSYTALSAARIFLTLSLVRPDTTCNGYIDKFDSVLQIINGHHHLIDNRCAFTELLHQHHAVMLYFLISSHVMDHNPARISASLAHSQALFPHNTLMARVRCKLGAFDRLRDLTLANTDASPFETSPTGLITSLETECARLRQVPGMPINAARLAMERCVAHPALTHQSLLWSRYIELEVSAIPREALLLNKAASALPRREVQRLQRLREPVRAVFLRAVTACPWNKLLILEGLSSEWLGERDKADMLRRMDARGMRVIESVEGLE